MGDQNKDIQKSFDSTLKGANLKDVTIDIVELSIDQGLKDGILREIPIVKTIVSLASIGANIHDWLFLKKIMSFMKEISDIDPKDRAKMINHIDSSGDYRLKVGEKLLYIIDSCSDHESSALVAKMFHAYLTQEIKMSYDNFLDSAAVLQKINPRDLEWFLEWNKNEYDVAEASVLIGSGLFEVGYEDVYVSVEDEDDWESGNKYKTNVDGGKMYLNLTIAGALIRKVLGSEPERSGNE